TDIKNKNLSETKKLIQTQHNNYAKVLMSRNDNKKLDSTQFHKLLSEDIEHLMQTKYK
ncbi:hypothetical protein LCGC14_2535670, partial [marine sediment metagenome]